MRQRHQRTLDYTGLNLIRIVIGSYFMAIALGLIKGISPPIMFLPFAPVQVADLIGTIILFSVTTCFMVGLYLRMTSLMLAIFVLATSVAQHIVLPEKVLIEPFWRDLTMVCAVLLSYSCLKRSEINRVAIVGRRSTPKIEVRETVTPRRVRSSAPLSDRWAFQADYATSLKPLMTRVPDHSSVALLEAPEVDSQPDAPTLTRRQVRNAEAEEPEVENIFAGI